MSFFHDSARKTLVDSETTSYYHCIGRCVRRAWLWRERLCDLSWYMRGLNEYLARRANAEDGCKGRFWTVERIRRLLPQPVSAPQEAEERVPVGAANVQPPLMPLVKASQDDHVHVLGYTERDYLELVDWAGRAIRADKRGAIPSLIPPILNRLGLDPGRYLHHMGGKSKLTQHITAIGPLVGNCSRRCSRSLAPGAIYRLHPCNRTSGIHAVDRLQALAK